MEQYPQVETIQVVLEGELLRRVDRAARRLKLNRSALVREALRQHLKQLQLRHREEADRRGYQRKPEDAETSRAWDGAAAWPDD